RGRRRRPASRRGRRAGGGEREGAHPRHRPREAPGEPGQGVKTDRGEVALPPPGPVTMVCMPVPRELYTQEHEDFRAVVHEFLTREVLPHHARWEADGQVDREIYAAAGKRGVLGFAV